MFTHIIFDLDNTLYPHGSGLMAEIARRIQEWLLDRLNLTSEEAEDLRQHYLRNYGATMGGLIAERSIDVDDYLAFVHDIPIEEYLRPDPALAAMLDSIPLRKVIYTNATSGHARRVLRALSVTEHFECVIGIEEMDLRNKFNHESYQRVLKLLNAEGQRCIMVEDSSRNLRPAKALGLTTVLVSAEGPVDTVDTVGKDAHVDFTVENVLEVERVVKELLRSTPR